MISRKQIVSVTPYITLLICAAAWQFITWFFTLPDWLLPSPELVWKNTAVRASSLPLHFGVTLFETVAGFILALVIGVPLAMLIVWSPILRNAVYPILVLFQSIPKISIAPLFLIWVGYGTESKVLMAFLVAFFPIVVDTASGLGSTPSELVDMSRTLRATPARVFFGIRLPWALPYVFSGMKVAISLALIGAIIGEFVGSDTGLGYLILVASGNMNTGLMFGVITILALMGLGLFLMIEFVERWLCPWYVSHTAEAPPTA